MFVYFNGLLLGLSLITALGPQNVFLIRQGTLKKHAFLSASICFICDFILIWASIAGLHRVLALHPALQEWLTWFGVAFLIWYGVRLIKQALAKKEKSQVKEAHNRLQIICLSLGFSLLNPHAIIDSLVIIGSGSQQFVGHHQAFLFGVVSASFLWFSSLTFTTRYFSNVLSKATIWRRLEVSSGLLMLLLSVKLAFSQL